MKKKLSLLAFVAAFFACSCEDFSTPPVEQPAEEQTATDTAAAQQPVSQQDDADAPQQITMPQIVAPDTTIVEVAADEPEDGMVREKARRGMGKKGQGYGGGMVTQPIATYFQTRDRIAFEMQIPHEMNLYKAMNGRYPKDLDEFMNKIIKPAGIQLPQLPEGHRYVYDPQKGELLVERPR